MKVLLIGNYPPDQQESMQRFASLLESELRARGHRVQLLQPRARLNRSGAPPVGRAKWLGYLDKFVLFPLLLKRAARRADVVHITDHSNAMYVRHLKNKPLLLTCNDVLAIRSALGLVPQNPTGATGKVLQNLILRGLNRAPQVACISEKTRQQLLEISSRPPATTTVIEMGLNYPYAPMPAEAARACLRALIGEPRADQALRRGFVLHVGANHWYKNRIGALRIYSHLWSDDAEKTPLLITAGKPLDEASREIVETRGLGDCCRRDSWPVQRRVARFVFVGGCAAFSFAGRGVWLANCRSSGLRLSGRDDGRSAHESSWRQCGGLYRSSRDEIGAAQILREVLDETESEKRERIAAGLRQAKQFSTGRMVDSYLFAPTRMSVATKRLLTSPNYVRHFRNLRL